MSSECAPCSSHRQLDWKLNS
uniref:Uncharacterized protein n=1 Tax=Arundo donax TaxID=35708 RepID=A0A0A9BNH2_ARUDO